MVAEFVNCEAYMDDTMPQSVTQPDPDVCAQGEPPASEKRSSKRKASSAAIVQRILERLDVLDSRLETLSTSTPDLSDQLDPADLVERIGAAIGQQNIAIAGITDAVTQLQMSLPSAIAESVRTEFQSQQLQASPPPSPATDAVDTTEEATEAEVHESTPPEDAWSQIRDAFLTAESDEPTLEAEPEPPTEQPAAEPQAELPEADLVQSDRDGLETLLAGIPTLVDPEDIPDDQLRSSLLDRDRFIATLVHRLQRSLPKCQPLTTDQLRELAALAPEEMHQNELHQRIEETLRQLDAQVRLGELELSLERARVARQVASLETTRERLAASARSIGLNLNEDGTLDGEIPAQVKTSRSRRWLGAMGFGE